jgi:lysophospholipase L1-like esterase
MINKIWVVGDSHARAFSYNDNFIPIFIGEGRGYCFIDEVRLSNLISKVAKIIKEVNSQDTIIFLLGEPDTRFYLKRGWKPWKKRRNKGWRYLINRVAVAMFGKRKVKNSFSRYCRFITEIRKRTDATIMILNLPPSMRKDQNRLVDYFNKMLSEFCATHKKAEFIDINDTIYEHRSQKIKNEYFGDQVHLNMKIQPLVENWLIQRGYLERSHYSWQKSMDKKKLKKKFSYNERFGCYTL